MGLDNKAVKRGYGDFQESKKLITATIWLVVYDILGKLESVALTMLLVTYEINDMSR